jgi:hypothetical protein
MLTFRNKCQIENLGTLLGNLTLVSKSHNQGLNKTKLKN